MRETFKLTEHERLNPVWPKLMKYMEAKLQELRAQNDAELSPEKTAFQRGKIAQLKSLMNLDKDLPITE